MSVTFRFRLDQQGSVVPVLAISSLLLFGAIGGVMTYTSAATTRNALQQAVDAGVLAGMALPNGTSPGERVKTAKRVFRANIGNFASANAGAASDEFIGDMTSAVHFTVDGASVSGSVTAKVTNQFSRFIGDAKMTVAVSSRAIRRSTKPVCILALEEKEPSALEMNGNPRLNAQDCVAQTNSSNPSAMKAAGVPRAQAEQFGVVGKVSGAGFSPDPMTGVDKINDPLAGTPFPFVGPCVNVPKNLPSPVVLSPGTYCGGLDIGSDTVVTLLPGIYVMKDGPSWTKGNAVVRGQEVMIAFSGKGATLQVNGRSEVTLTSPRNGPYMNIQFLQDVAPETKGLTASIGGAAGEGTRLSYDGIMYFPTQDIWIYGNANVIGRSPNYLMIGNKLSFQGDAVVDFALVNTRGLAVPGTVARIQYSAMLDR